VRPCLLVSILGVGSCKREWAVRGAANLGPFSYTCEFPRNCKKMKRYDRVFSFASVTGAPLAAMADLPSPVPGPGPSPSPSTPSPPPVLNSLFGSTPPPSIVCVHSIATKSGDEQTQANHRCARTAAVIPTCAQTPAAGSGRSARSPTRAPSFPPSAR
jgi:hypothetical protein